MIVPERYNVSENGAETVTDWAEWETGRDNF